jgi:hypothetical protein
MPRKPALSAMEQRRQLAEEAAALAVKREALEASIKAEIGEIAVRVGALDLDAEVIAGALARASEAVRAGDPVVEELRALGGRFLPRRRARKASVSGDLQAPSAAAGVVQDTSVMQAERRDDAVL